MAHTTSLYDGDTLAINGAGLMAGFSPAGDGMQKAIFLLSV